MAPRSHHASSQSGVLHAGFANKLYSQVSINNYERSYRAPGLRGTGLDARFGFVLPLRQVAQAPVPGGTPHRNCSRDRPEMVRSPLSSCALLSDSSVL